MFIGVLYGHKNLDLFRVIELVRLRYPNCLHKSCLSVFRGFLSFPAYLWRRVLRWQTPQLRGEDRSTNFLLSLHLHSKQLCTKCCSRWAERCGREFFLVLVLRNLVTCKHFAFVPSMCELRQRDTWHTRRCFRIFRSARGAQVKRKQNGAQSATRACRCRVHSRWQRNHVFSCLCTKAEQQWEMVDAT